MGFPINKHQLLDSVTLLCKELKRPNKFNEPWAPLVWGFPQKTSPNFSEDVWKPYCFRRGCHRSKHKKLVWWSSELFYIFESKKQKRKNGDEQNEIKVIEEEIDKKKRLIKVLKRFKKTKKRKPGKYKMKVNIPKEAPRI